MYWYCNRRYDDDFHLYCNRLCIVYAFTWLSLVMVGKFFLLSGVIFLPF